jgi:predicted nucleotidyltransferase
LPSLETLLDTLREQLPDLRDRYGVRTLGIFGSHVHGNPRRGSDLDILVEFDDRPLTLLQFIELENHLGEMLGIKVDLVERDTLKPAIGRRILGEVVRV